MPFPPLARAQLAWLCATTAAGFLGCLGGTRGALDPLTLLGWLALLAPGAGALVGAQRIALAPFGLAAPGAWFLALVALSASSARPLPTPYWAALAVTGLYAGGLAVGARARSGPAAAGGLLFVALFLAGATLGGGLLAGGAELAREHPRLAALLLDVSPLVLVFDCAGWDWVHGQPAVYAGSGIEWFQRRPYGGSLAGPVVLVVGCALAWLAPRVPRRSTG